MKKRIFRSYFLLITVILIIMVLFFTEMTLKIYQKELENELKSIAYFIEYSILSNKNMEAFDYQKYAREISQHQSLYNPTKSSFIVSFLDYSGKVLADSENNYSNIENEAQKKEIQEAIKGIVGKDLRKNKDEDLLYIAIPVKGENLIIRVSIPLLEYKKITQQISLYGFFAILIGAFIGGIVSFKISKSITQPFDKIIDAANQISKGNYSNKIDINQKDELLLLATSFNNMAFELQNHVTNLQNKKDEIESIIDSMPNGLIAIDRDKNIIFLNPVAADFFNIIESSDAIGKNILNTIRNHQINQVLTKTLENNSNEEIEILYKEDTLLNLYTSPIKTKNSTLLNAGCIAYIQNVSKIRKLEQMRTDFVSNVTHELKTPLTSIKGFIDTLKNGSINDPKRAMRFLDIIDIEADRLTSLIGDILELSEIEFKKTDADMIKIDLNELVNEIFEISYSITLEKNITLINNTEDGVFIVANRNRMKQLLLNVINNAIKYNQGDGSVTVSAIQSSGCVVIKIKDTGIGIDKDSISRIFERFYRVDKGRSRDIGGTGLGLSIVKHIVQLYNGTISVNSDTDQGSEFIIQLPQTYT